MTNLSFLCTFQCSAALKIKNKINDISFQGYQIRWTNTMSCSICMLYPWTLDWMHLDGKTWKQAGLSIGVWQIQYRHVCQESYANCQLQRDEFAIAKLTCLPITGQTCLPTAAQPCVNVNGDFQVSRLDAPITLSQLLITYDGCNKTESTIEKLQSLISMEK